MKFGQHFPFVLKIYSKDLIPNETAVDCGFNLNKNSVDSAFFRGIIVKNETKFLGWDCGTNNIEGTQYVFIFKQ